MRICKVLAGETPWDLRSDRMVRSLTEAGHELFIACADTNVRPARSSPDAAVSLRPIHALPWLPESINARLAYPTFISPRWLRLIASIVEQDRCDAILVRDLPLALAGILVGQRLRKPVVLDLPDDYAASLDPIRAGIEPMRKDPVLRNSTLARSLEDLAIRRAQRVIVASHESFSRFVTRGLNPRHGAIVRNAPLFSEIRSRAATDPRGGREPFTMLYVGPVASYAGLDTVLRALPEIHRRHGSARVVIRGTGPAIPELMTLGARLGINASVDFVGGNDCVDDAALMRRADVCLLPHHRSVHSETWLPPALFDYMAQGRPVLVSGAAALVRIVERERCGTVFEAGDSLSFARAVADLHDESLRHVLGTAGRRAVCDRYHWERESLNLIDLFAALAESPIPGVTDLRDRVLSTGQTRSADRSGRFATSADSTSTGPRAVQDRSPEIGFPATFEVLDRAVAHTGAGIERDPDYALELHSARCGDTAMFRVIRQECIPGESPSEPAALIRREWVYDSLESAGRMFTALSREQSAIRVGNREVQFRLAEPEAEAGHSDSGVRPAQRAVPQATDTHATDNRRRVTG